METSTELAWTCSTYINSSGREAQRQSCIGCTYKMPTEKQAVHKLDVGIRRYCVGSIQFEDALSPSFAACVQLIIYACMV